MRLYGVLLWFGAASWSAYAQGSVDVAAALPDCATRCLASALTEARCAATNETCVCTTWSLQQTARACVLQSCTQRQTLTTINITSTACGAPIRDRSGEYNALSISLGILSAIIASIRVAYQYLSSTSAPGWDDWFMILILTVSISSITINSVGFVPNGLGRDVWTIPFDTLTTFVKWFYIMEVLYFLQVALLKTSVLFFYLRIFGHTGTRIFIIGTLVFNALYGIVFVFVAAFQCRPVSYYWTNWDGEHEGTCMDVNAIAWANAAISIALDFWVLALPLSQIRSLNLHWKKKIGVALMFCVGAFVTVVSIIRLRTLVVFAKSHNPTWEQFDVANWSTIEINVGIICACMPALRLVLVRFFPRILGSTREHASSTGDQYGKSTSGNRGVGNRKLGSESVVKTISQDDRSPTAAGRGTAGILCTRDVTIDYHDEISLVRMQDLERSSMKDGSSWASS